MYQRMLEICSPPERASGPGIDPEAFCTNPVLQEECLDHLTMGSRKKFSRYVSELMDGLGYSYEMIKHRQQLYCRYFGMANSKDGRENWVTTGGKGEGTTLLLESDFDNMIVIQNVICTDNPIRFINQENLTLICMNRSETSPGYTKLKLLKLENNVLERAIRQSLFEAEDGTYYLSSPCFTEACRFITRQTGLKEKEISGPSFPVFDEITSFDTVCAFICDCPDLLNNWVSRRRCHGWPSPDIIQQVSLLDAHVVPVGFKGSEEMYREWRICFSLAELHLMRIFNETQLKVYILLKKICKSVLSPVCENMTSYIMKNVVFWVCEEKGIQQFTRDLLMDRLFDCIIYLRTCVIKNCLPSYMIPERNLFAVRLDIQQRQQLTSLLGNLLHEEGRMLLRCDQLRDTMIVSYIRPEMFKEFSKKRDQVEILWLVDSIIEVKKQLSDLPTGEELRTLEQKSFDIMNYIVKLMQIDVHALQQAGRTIKEISELFTTRIIRIMS